MKEDTLSYLLPLLYLVTFAGTTILLFRANYILFMRVIFAPLALGAATVAMLLEKTYPSLGNTLSLGLAGGALLFLVVQLYLVIDNLMSQPNPKAIAKKIAFNRDSE